MLIAEKACALLHQRSRTHTTNPRLQRGIHISINRQNPSTTRSQPQGERTISMEIQQSFGESIRHRLAFIFSPQDSAQPMLYLLEHSPRIVVAGTPGAGKSHLAQAIQHHTLHSYTELDELYFDENWRPRSDFDRKAQEILEQPNWLVDWQYSAREIILEKADLFIWCRTSFFRCLIRILKRSARRSGETLWTGVKEPGVCAQLLNPRLTFWWTIRNFCKERQAIATAAHQHHQAIILNPRNVQRLLDLLDSTEDNPNHW